MQQIDLFELGNEHSIPTWQAIDNGTLLWLPHFLSSEAADTHFDTLRRELPWRQESIQIFGQQRLQPRLQVWCGDKPYGYSGLNMQPLAWHPTLSHLRALCSTAANHPFNSVLCNLYRDGQDSMGWHQDNEPELGRNPIIASLNLGETRRFLLRNLHCKSTIEFELTHGSLLVMAGAVQHHWRHSVPKTRVEKGERINLTFRTIL